MQIESFMPLHEKYHDEGSPAIESLERVKGRASQKNRKYYFIVKDGARVGAINIGRKSSDPEDFDRLRSGKGKTTLRIFQVMR